MSFSFRSFAVAVVLAIVALAPVCGAWAQTDYKLGPDSQVKENVPHGTTTHYTFKNSRIFPGTERDYWVYVPAQYDKTKPACVMVFQDGGGWQSANGGFRVPVVFDNLIASGEMPVCVAVMVNPGVVPAANPNALPRYNRAYEYDTPSDAYARFLVSELLPEVGKTVNLTTDPNGRAIAGSSSGGMAAFTAAWFRPDLFRRVVSYIGSFTDLRGGDLYPSQVRKMEPKPIRVFMQDGSRDQDIYGGAWFLANTDLAAALKFSGYDYQFVIGDGGHSGQQGASILPDALRYIWKGYPAPIIAASNDRQPIMNLVTAGGNWKLAYEGKGAIGGIAPDANGNVLLSDTGRDAVLRLPTDGGAATVWREKTGGVGPLAFAPNGDILAAQPEKGRIVSLGSAPNGKETVLAKSAFVSALTVGHDGTVYATDKREGRLYTIAPTAGAKTTLLPLDADLPGGGRGVCLSPDQTLLFVSPQAGGTNGQAKTVYSYQLLDGGKKAAYRETYHDLSAVAVGSGDTGASGMATDTNGWLYVATNAGICVCDQAGRTNGIINAPTVSVPTTHLAFGGLGNSVLYAVAGNRVYKRQTKAVGVHSQSEPTKPPGPRL